MTHTLRIAYPETVIDRPASVVWHGAGTLADAVAATIAQQPDAVVVVAADLRGFLPGGIN